MLTLPAELTRLYETLLRQQGITRQHPPHYTKWLRYYWDFCHKYGFEPNDRQSFRRSTRSCEPRISLTSNVSRRSTRSLFTTSRYWGNGTAGSGQR
jgi:hypothetical protein